MRVLILTHPRSGGFSLLAWISRELNHESYHEPFLNPKHTRAHADALTRPRACVKEDITHLIDQGIDVRDFVAKFDLVLFHLRKNHRATAISWVRQLEAGESHEIYALDEDWIRAREPKIARTCNDLMGINGAILYQASVCQVPHLYTSYEGIYETGEDISRICELIGVRDPLWLDMLNPKRRLQNGTPMPDPVKKRNLL